MLMTAESWRKKTSSVFADRKNPLITDIDILLGEYHPPPTRPTCRSRSC